MVAYPDFIQLSGSTGGPGAALFDASLLTLEPLMQRLFFCATGSTEGDKRV